METFGKNGFLIRRPGLVLSVSALPVAGFFLWLKIHHGITYLGAVPTLALWIVPTYAGIWLGFWRRPMSARMRWILGACTAAAAISVVTMSIAHGIGLE